MIALLYLLAFLSGAALVFLLGYILRSKSKKSGNSEGVTEAFLNVLNY